MYKNLVDNYVRSMSFSTLDKYISKNYPNVSMDEKKVIYYYIKNRWQELYDEDTKVLEEVRKKVSDETYNEILKLLNMAYKLKNR